MNKKRQWKKEWLIIGIILGIFILSQTINEEKISIIGRTVLDTWSTVSLNASISIDNSPPDIIIDSPENRTYVDTGNNLSLNFIVTDSVSDIDTIMYNLNDIENITITGNLTFNASAGSYKLNLLANDSKGFLNNSKSVSFSVASEIVENLDVDENGDVEFTDLSVKETIEKVSGLPTSATVTAVNFNSTKPSSWTEPSSNTVETALKYFEINVSEATSGGSYTINFNLTQSELGSTSASSIRLYTFESDWQELSTSVLDSSSDPASFSATTTHFSQFLIGEKSTPASTTPTGGTISGSTGGAIGGKGRESSFDVDQETLKVSLKKGASLIKPIKIKNTGDGVLEIFIDFSESLKGLFWLPKETLRIKPGEEGIFNFNIITGEGIAPGVYIGEVFLKSEKISKLIRTIIEIESEKPLFDIDLEIPLAYKKIDPGEKLKIQATLINLGGLKDKEVSIEYLIKNSKGESILKEEETIKVREQASFSKEFLIPKDTVLGEYVIAAIVKYKDSIGTASEVFIIGKMSVFGGVNALILIGILVIIGITILFYKKGLKNIEKLQKIRLKKLDEKPEIPKAQLREKLEKELKLLEKSYKAKYITEEAYVKGKKRIKDMLK